MKFSCRAIIVLSLALTPSLGLASLEDGDLSSKIDFQRRLSLQNLMQNLETSGIRRGAVIASPSRENPDYFYHWTRDAALVMDSLITAYEVNGVGDSKGSMQLPAIEKARLRSQIMDWVSFERRIQGLTGLLTGLGEPRFMVDGTGNFAPWGRPQSDGPALRALAMIRWARVLMREGDIQTVVNNLYGGGLPARGAIKTDLEYVAHNWRNSSYDLWEEVRGDHFYTRLVQRRALIEGAFLAETLGDFGARDFYQGEAAALTYALGPHRRSMLGHIDPTLNQVDGWEHKNSRLDVAVILGSLHGRPRHETNGERAEEFLVDDEWVLATAQKLEERFRMIYPVNQDNPEFGAAIGRYPEDVYNGAGFSVGNPWFLAVHAYAELHCRLATQLERKGVLEITTLNGAFYRYLQVSELRAGTTYTMTTNPFRQVIVGLRARGLSFLKRSLFHRSQDPLGHMSEQFSRFDGFMKGARGLSWSYASYITAYEACH